MVLFDLLKIFFPILDENHCKVHLANTHRKRFPLDLYRKGLFEDWQSWQSQDTTFNKRHIVSLIQLPKKDMFLFAGGFISKGCKEVQNPKDRKYGAKYKYRYQTKEIREMKPLSGLIVVRFSREGSKQPYRVAMNCAPRLFICEPTPNLRRLEEIMNHDRTSMAEDELKNAILQCLRPEAKTEGHSGEVPQEEELAFSEGRILYRMHSQRERSSSLIRRKKETFLKEHERLTCEICGFDFEDTYGPLGKEFIECHHIVPVSQLSPGSKTRPEDLCLVCSNCHRMLHRGGLYSPEELRKKLKSGNL